MDLRISSAVGKTMENLGLLWLVVAGIIELGQRELNSVSLSHLSV
jgi:hypothetical protein